MSFWSVRRSIVSAQLLTKLAAEYGHPASLCLRGTAISDEALADSSTEISAAQELQLVRNFLQILGHVPGIGLEAGLRYRLSTYGILGFAMVSNPTFRQGCEFASRYLDLTYSFVSFRLEKLDAQPQVWIDDSAIPVDVRQFLVERDFTAAVNAFSEMLPTGARLRELIFSFPRPEYAGRFNDFFGIEPYFSAARNVAVFDPHLFNMPLPQANPLMARLGEEQCKLLLARRQVNSGFAGKVRERLLRSTDRIPTIEEVASDFFLGPRSLRRKLQEEGASFRDLANEVRLSVAEAMLAASSMKLVEISERLGYSDTSAFINAFKRGKGMSPTEYRESLTRSARPAE